MNDIKIFEKDEHDRLIVSNEIVSRLKDIDSQISDLNAEESTIRNMILDGMVENQIVKCSSYGMTFTQVMPKPTGTFDVDSFLINEPEDVVKCFTTFEEETEFDIDKFKDENPELYEKYVKKNIIPTVDTKKMEKTLTPIFNKYWHEVPSEKPVTLRVTTKKGE